MDLDTVEEIIAGEHIRPVYQPIVSLVTGQIFGYEALSRVSVEKFQLDIEYMFRVADMIGRSWELETLCRTKAMENASSLGTGKKLFLNVNPNIIYDEAFREGFTKAHLNRYGLDEADIIFEITERVAISDTSAFLGSIDHYKRQNYGIAIDDVGSGYSGLNVIASIHPDFLKLDMALVRNVDKDEIKESLCKAMVEFGKRAGIKVIAEGIETDEELRTLIKLGVDFGQGYYLGVPQDTFTEIAPEKVDLIKTYFTRQYTEDAVSSLYPIVGHLAKPVYAVAPDEQVGKIYEVLRANPTITELAVVEDDIALGFMTRAEVMGLLGGRYGYALYAKKEIGRVMDTDFLCVNFNMTVDQVSKMAMQRSAEQLYNPILVENDKKYFGILTVKDLLEMQTKVALDVARHSNPLTGLPGNLVIEKEILSHISGDGPYCITYYDIDNFKAYNDAYGFENGDKMLALLADILKECATRNQFIGHIGGDDFIVICDCTEGERYGRAVIERFAERVLSLYHEQDVRNGFIQSINRSGISENFPIASLSVAGISSKARRCEDIDDFSHEIAALKKKCKRQIGNYIEII